MKEDSSYGRLADLVRNRVEFKRQWRPRSGLGFFYSAAEPSCRHESSFEGDTETRITGIKTPKGELRAVEKTVPGTNVWVTVKHWVESREDLEKFFTLPYQPLRPRGESFLALEREVGEAGVVTHRLVDALGLVERLVKSETLYKWVATDTERVIALLDFLATRVHDYVEYLMRGPARPIFIIGGPEVSTPPMLGPRFFERLVTRYDQPLLKLMRDAGAPVIFHCHGNVEKVLDQILEMAPNGLHPVEEPPMGDITLEEFKARVGSRLCLVGNIQIGDMLSCTPAEIREKCERLLHVGGEGGGLMVSPTATPYQVPLAENTYRNYQQLIETVQEKGWYGPE
jgi:hypothetical protein